MPASSGNVRWRPTARGVGRSALLVCMAIAAALAPSAQASKQKAVSEQTSGTEIILLGTAGGPVARTLRSQPANAVVVDRKVYLIDLGNGVLRQLAMAGFAVTDVEAAFITHHHFDHNADLGTFMAFDWVANRSNVVTIVGPPGTGEIASAALNAFKRSMEIFSSETGKALPEVGGLFNAIDGIAPGVVFQDDLVRVTAVENSHYVAMRPGSPGRGRDKSYSYRFETKDRSIVFTGDTGPSDAVRKLAQGADVLVSEVLSEPRARQEIAKRAAMAGYSQAQADAELRHMLEGHLSSRALGEMAAAAGVKTLVLTHYGPTPAQTMDVSDFVGEVRQHFKGQIIEAKDLTRL